MFNKTRSLEECIKDISAELAHEKKVFDQATREFTEAKTYTVSDNGGSVGDYNYYIYPFKGITLTNFKLLEILSKYLAKMVPKDTEVILTIESDGISVGSFVAAELGLPLIICKSFHYHTPCLEFTQKTGYYNRTMYMPKIIAGKKVAIVDCMVSTGGTVKAMIETILQLENTQVTGVFCLNNKDNYQSGLEAGFAGHPYRYLFDTRIGTSGQVECDISGALKRTLWEATDKKLFGLTEDVAAYSNVSSLGHKVGAIILDSDTLEIVAWGNRRGNLHAEEDAISMLKQDCPDWESRRFTLYSTLEPCTYRKNAGHTPCAELISAISQIHWVVVGAIDTIDTQINGTGIDHLQNNGKHVRMMDGSDRIYNPPKAEVREVVAGTI